MLNKNLMARTGAFWTTMLISGHAMADRTANETMDKIAQETSNLPQLMMITAYVVGIGFAISGLLKVKDSVENPGNAPVKDGFMRLLIGGGLLALGFVIDNMVGTIGAEGTQELTVTDAETWDALGGN